jgi:glucuronosyltransferase
MKFFNFCVVIFLFLAECEGKKILIVSSTFSRSHIVPLQVLAKGLTERDHNVTFLSAFSSTKSIENLREIKVDMNDEDKALYEEIGKIFSTSVSKLGVLSAAPKLFNLIYKFGNDTLNSQAVRELKKEKFDLVIIGYFLSDFLLGLADHFDCPSIVYFSASPFAIVNKMVGNPLSPEGAHHILDSSKNLNFLGRVNNFMVNAFDYVVQKNIAYYNSRKVYE